MKFDYDSIQFSEIFVVVDPKLSHEDMYLSQSFFGEDLIKSMRKTNIEGYPDSYGYNITLHKHNLVHMAYAIEKIHKIPGVINVFPLISSGYHNASSDPAYTSNEQWGLSDINIERVWDFTTGSSEIRVGIIDSGIAARTDFLNIIDDSHIGIMNINKYSINGSYILPNGIIVLVDADIEAYLNGTLVFYDKDDIPVVQ